MPIAFGGDYNPEQWPEDLWPEDVRLMQQAGVTLVTVGVFAWALIEPREGHYTFDWLDRVLDLLHAGGVGVDLATATASPPPWLSRAHPELLPVTADGVRLSPGSRQAYCPSSPVFRQAATALAGQLAARYRDHPALVMWHVGNEYGAHVDRCWCDVSAAAFRRWLEQRYGDVAALNDAWGTSFWSQRYGSFEQVLPPRATPAFGNPGQLLDFRRFSGDELLACYAAERAVLKAATPHLPVTTNLMVPMVQAVDARRWVPHVDVVANDHYLQAADPRGHVELALGADLCRGLGGGRPWLVMEHSTGAVQWQPRNAAKQPGQLRRNSLAHLARGADGLLFFQWRQSRAGAERWHSALVPHAGTDSRLWREVVQLGQDLQALAEVEGEPVAADVALLWDWETWWAVEPAGPGSTAPAGLPSVDLTYREQVLRWYTALWERGVAVDAVHPSDDLSAYRLVLAPSLYLLDAASAGNLTAYVDGGGSLAVGPFSGLVDEHDRVWPGTCPGALRDALGLVVEEPCPLLAGQAVRLSDGGAATVWTERLRLLDAQPVLTFLDGPAAGLPAVTRRDIGRGTAWYVATVPEPDALARLLRQVCDAAGVQPVAEVPAGVEVVRRGGHLFVLNHTDGEVAVPADGTELLGATGLPAGARVRGELRVPAGGVAVVRTSTPTCPDEEG